jgi:hypothetical protein
MMIYSSNNSFKINRPETPIKRTGWVGDLPVLRGLPSHRLYTIIGRLYSIILIRLQALKGIQNKLL